MGTTIPSPARRLDVRLDEDHAVKLESLRRRTRLSVRELVERGIDLLYGTGGTGLPPEGGPRPALDVLREQGFVGSGEGPADLSVDYREEHARALAHKHGDR